MAHALISLALTAIWLVVVGVERLRDPVGVERRHVLPFVLAGVALGLGYLARPTLAVLLPALAVGIVLAARDRRASLRPI